MLVTGLAKLLKAESRDFDEALQALGLDTLIGQVRVVERSVRGIGGFGLQLTLPQEHEHRTLSDVLAFFEKATLSETAKTYINNAFRILAEAEGSVHGIPPEEVHFHEVGALDSLLDIGLAAIFFEKLGVSSFICGPLPICDGTIHCAHGPLPAPAPAVLALLKGVRIIGLDSSGETVTPTGLALLKAFGAQFGPWPEMLVLEQTLVYGSRILPGVPNGALFVLGESTPKVGE
jgi:uncharacterized protein (DUF111 family)